MAIKGPFDSTGRETATSPKTVFFLSKLFFFRMYAIEMRVVGHIENYVMGPWDSATQFFGVSRPWSVVESTALTSPRWVWRRFSNFSVVCMVLMKRDDRKGKFYFKPRTFKFPVKSRSHGSVRVVRTTSEVNGKCWILTPKPPMSPLTDRHQIWPAWLVITSRIPPTKKKMGSIR